MGYFPDFTVWQFAATCLIFIWTGFVRTGLGFGGAALGLPLMLMVHDQPIFWIPVIGSHLLLFSGLTLSNRLHNVDWVYLAKSGKWILPAAIGGVFGLLKLPNEVLLFFIYAITVFYGACWAFNKVIGSRNEAVDVFLLLLGGYVSGASLTGAPLMIAVFMRNVVLTRLRDTLFVLWFLIVSIKLITLYLVAVPLNSLAALMLVPAATVGHVVGLKTHEFLLARDVLCKRIIGIFLLFVSGLGLLGLWTGMLGKG